MLCRWCGVKEGYAHHPVCQLNDVTTIKDDPVSHPAHYTRGTIEVIDFIEDQQLGYHLGQVIKYVCRAGYKDASTRKQDLEKARWYLTREIDRAET